MVLYLAFCRASVGFDMSTSEDCYCFDQSAHITADGSAAAVSNFRVNSPVNLSDFRTPSQAHGAKRAGRGELRTRQATSK